MTPNEGLELDNIVAIIEEIMKVVKIINRINSVVLCALMLCFGILAQEKQMPQSEKIVQESSVSKEGGKTEKQKKSKKNKDASIFHTQSLSEVSVGQENLPEAEAAVLPYYANYLAEYRLGPNDVISVEVFGQCPDYCKTGITVPPTAKISYPLIREGVFVGGKTIEQIQEEITKKLDEYVIDPKVSVTLDKAMSARYSVLGKVAAPGVRVMDRKVSLYEAIVEAGGALKDADKKRITLYRLNGQGKLTTQTVNLQELELGKAGMVYLNPGDQVFVPDQGFKLNANSILKVLEKASIVRLLFGSPF